MAEPNALDTLSRSQRVRRERILDAAEELFSRLGVRTTTMEGIALAAAVSKATVYAYFNDKSEVFRAVAARMADDMERGAQMELQGRGSTIERISNALLAKHIRAFDAVIGTAHARELLDTRRHEFRDLFNRVDQSIEEALADTLRNDGDKDARENARLIFRASIGICEQATSKTELERDLRRLVASILAS